MHVIVWQFRPREGQAAEFERLYGPEGAWVLLFRKSAGYLGTELLRGEEGYLTIDRWASEEEFQAFQASHEREYAALDRQGETLTESEALVGKYEVVGRG